MSSTRSRSPPALNAPSAPRTSATRVSSSVATVFQTYASSRCASASTALSRPALRNVMRRTRGAGRSSSRLGNASYGSAIAGTLMFPSVVPEARLERTEHGLVARGDGWYVVNARDAVWRHTEGRTSIVDFEGEPGFRQLGINVSVMRPGEAMAMYHWEADQEDFLVVAGEATLIVEGVERPLRPWDFVHCPAQTKH